MHKWNRTILIAMVTGLLLGSAVPAQAQQVPFDFDLPITAGISAGIDAADRGSGFVGGCDVKLQCVGASVTVSNTEGGVAIGGVRVRLAGSVCLLDTNAPCGSAGDPGTGIVFTTRDLIVEGSNVEVPDFSVEYCVWERAPRSTPSSCTTVPVDASTLTPVSTKTGMTSLGDALPERVIIGSFAN